QASQGWIGDAIGEHRDLKIVLTETLREADFLMMRAFDSGREVQKADTGVGFAQVGGSGIETFFCTRIGTRSRVIVFDHGVWGKMHVHRGVGAKGIEAPEKLDGLEFAAELEFEDIPKNEVISCGKRQRLESGVVQVRIGRSEAA